MKAIDVEVPSSNSGLRLDFSFEILNWFSQGTNYKFVHLLIWLKNNNTASCVKHGLSDKGGMQAKDVRE